MPELSALERAARAANSYGLEVVLAVGMSLMLFFVIKWVLSYFKESTKAMANIINVTLVNQTAALNEIRNALMTNNEWAREAVKRMREEHEQILHGLHERP